MMKKKKHIPVLLRETILSLNIKKNGIYIDCTFGCGGHSNEILKKIGNNGKLYAIDVDPSAIQEAKKITDSRFKFFQGSFSNIIFLLKKENLINKVDGILLDLGVSSVQLDDPKRGFSFNSDGPLDMRMNPISGITASTWLSTNKEKKIADVLKKFGEERYAKKIARAIVKRNEISLIKRTTELSDLIKKNTPFNKSKHPARCSFQAIRIYLNQELNELKKILNESLKLLSHKGRLSIISFHSLEDRIIKKFFINHSRQHFFIPNKLPITENQIKKIKKNSLKVIGRIFPNANEINKNYRSRSAILRIAEKI
ncbi:Ribosomal RNA small subunit methyltransferase H [Buchnera aphidicola (Mindarus abietinus)]